MKKIVMVCFFAAVAVSGFSQIKYGVKAGVNFSNLDSDGSSFDSRIAPLFGGFAEIGINDKVSFRPELVYSMEGAKEESTQDIMGVNVKVEETLKMDYLNLPLLFKYKVGSGISLIAGPQVGFLLSAKDKIKASAQGQSETETTDMKDAMKGTNISLGLGAGWDAESGLGIDVRYNIGLSNIADNTNSDVKTKGLQLSVSYSF